MIQIDGNDIDYDLAGLAVVELISDGSEWHTLNTYGNATPVIGAANLIAWWKFDESEGTLAKDSSGYGNHLVLNNFDGNDDWVEGKIGGGLDFDGVDDYATSQNAIDFARNDYTISCWIKADVLSTTMDLFGGKTFNHGILLEINANDTLRFLHRNPPGGAGGDSKNSIQALSVSTWHHLVISRSDKMYLYIDGQEDSNHAYIDANFSSALDILVGALATTGTREFNGIIDDMRVYTLGLSADDISKIYQQGL